METVRRLTPSGRSNQQTARRRATTPSVGGGGADAEEHSRVIESRVAQESDRRVAIWLRVRLGGERMTTVAAAYGYRDGSGIRRVVQRLEKKAKDDQAFARRLKALAKHVSSVRS